MKNILFVDCQSGISGDMLVGAFLDAGMDFEYLESNIKKLNLKNVKIFQTNVKRAGFRAKKFVVNLRLKTKDQRPKTKSYHGLHIEEIYGKLDRLPKDVSDTAKKIFDVLIRAEKTVHGGKHAHLHEVGQIDSIIDVVGIAAGMRYFDIKEVYSTPVALNNGFVKCAHGKIPLPAPAVINLLKKAKIQIVDSSFELTTPTGASFLAAFCKKYTPKSPIFELERVGVGAGDQNPAKKPNILRLLIGKSALDQESADIYMIETNIDDMNPEWYESIFEELFKHKALDVYLSQVIMKKQRPGMVLHVLCEKRRLEGLQQVIFEHTTTFGLRYYPVQRQVLDREIEEIPTKFGKVKVKIGKLGSKIITVSPEYESCKKLAKKKKISLKDIYKEANKR